MSDDEFQSYEVTYTSKKVFAPRRGAVGPYGHRPEGKEAVTCSVGFWGRERALELARVLRAAGYTDVKVTTNETVEVEVPVA